MFNNMKVLKNIILDILLHIKCVYLINISEFLKVWLFLDLSYIYKKKVSKGNKNINKS